MATEKIFTADELTDIARRLETYDAIFSQLWQVGRPEFTTKVKTAAISFDEVGQVVCLHINPQFWAKQTPRQQDFVIAHEMLHVILEHGRRAKDADASNQQVNNTAMDVVVNELLVSGFGFNRKEIDPKDEYCWRDKVFKGRTDILAGQNFEYYLTKFPIQSGRGTGTKPGAGGGGKLVDDHSQLPTDADISQMAERVAGKLSQEEREDLEEKLGNEGKAVSPGDQAGGFIKTMANVRVPKKRKWESLIKKCLKRMEVDGLQESWLRTGRRMATVASSKTILPAEIDAEGTSKNRALVYMFLDTSGSCTSLASRFWRLAMSIPRDKFDVRLRCFDTKVYEVDLKKRKLYGFGGTYFHPLEAHIQKEIANGGRYPDGVFVLTDGDGNNVNPEKPERWHVLLTTGHRNCFPSSVECLDIRKFE